MVIPTIFFYFFQTLGILDTEGKNNNNRLQKGIRQCMEEKTMESDEALRVPGEDYENIGKHI